MAGVSLLFAFGDYLHGFLNSVTADRLKRPAFGLVVSDEKEFNPIKLFASHLVKRGDRSRVSRSVEYRDEPVVANRFAILCLFGLNYSEELGRHQATWNCWVIHQDEYVKRVAILAPCRWDKPKIQWE